MDEGTDQIPGQWRLSDLKELSPPIHWEFLLETRHSRPSIMSYTFMVETGESRTLLQHGGEGSA